MNHYVFLRRCNSWGGAEQQLMDYLKRINYQNNKVTLCITNDVFSNKINEEKLAVSVIKFPFDFNNGFWGRFSNMYNLLKSLNPKCIIFIQGGFYDFKLPDILAGRLLSKNNYSLEVSTPPVPLKKTSKLYFNIFPGLGLWWYKNMIITTAQGNLYKLIFTVSNDIKYRLTRSYGYPEHKTITTYHGIDLNKFIPNITVRRKMRLDLKIPKNDIVIISSARFSKEKCLHRLINVFDVIYKDFKNIWLVFVGNGPTENDLKILANSKSASAKILFLGHKNDVSKYLQMSDIFVLPSDVEGISISMLEALATGLVSIVTDISGLKEAIEDGVNGFIVERSEKGILSGLRKALTLNDVERNNICFNARKFIENNFNIEKRSREFLEILNLRSTSR